MVKCHMLKKKNSGRGKCCAKEKVKFPSKPSECVKKPAKIQDGGNSFHFAVLTHGLINPYAFRNLLAEWDL